MINAKDVIKMKVPFPSVDSGLAVAAHMYICRSKYETQYEFVKCQSVKPYMLLPTYNNPIAHYHDEEVDSARNPFRQTTRIDCEKLFSSKNVTYDDRLKANNPAQVCNDLFKIIQNKLALSQYKVIPMTEEELIRLNTYITNISDGYQRESSSNA